MAFSDEPENEPEGLHPDFPPDVAPEDLYGFDDWSPDDPEIAVAKSEDSAADKWRARETMAASTEALVDHGARIVLKVGTVVGVVAVGWQLVRGSTVEWGQQLIMKALDSGLVFGIPALLAITVFRKELARLIFGRNDARPSDPDN